MSTNDQITIAAIIALVGFGITVYNFLNARKKDTQSEDHLMENIRTSLMQANIKLDSLGSVTGDIKADIKVLNNKIQEQDKAIIIVKRDLETAFDKIDELRDEVRELQKG